MNFIFHGWTLFSLGLWRRSSFCVLCSLQFDFITYVMSIYSWLLDSGRVYMNRRLLGHVRFHEESFLVWRLCLKESSWWRECYDIGCIFMEELGSIIIVQCIVIYCEIIHIPSGSMSFRIELASYYRISFLSQRSYGSGMVHWTL